LASKFSLFVARLPPNCNFLRNPRFLEVVRTKIFVFEPPSRRTLHVSKWEFVRFRSSCRLVFDMTQITAFDLARNGFSMESMNLEVDL